MGSCCCTYSEEEQKRANEIRIYLMGAGESGKSTFTKQMRIRNGEGYTTEEMKDFIPLIFHNIISFMKSMIDAMDTLKIQYVDQQNIENSELIRSMDFEIVTVLEPQYIQAIKDLWADVGIQECYSRRREYQLIDSTKYFINKLDELTKSEYLPTLQDIVFTRKKTCDLEEYQFTRESRTFRIFDAGGQREERVKWTHMFEHAAAIIFFVAASEYDQVLFESEKLNRMDESLALFKTILKIKTFLETSVILFLNKKDLLEEKIMTSTSHLEDFFPQYTGPKRDFDRAKVFIKDMYEDQSTDRRVYSHFTNATDPENIEIVFTSVRDTIIRNLLKTFGLE